MHAYHVRRATAKPECRGLWHGPAWESIQAIDVAAFRPESTDHRPETRAKLVYDNLRIYGIFHVKDRFMHSTCTRYQDPVCKDSCVEFFVRPKPEAAGIKKEIAGYFNFEFNCGGTLYCSYITDPTIVDRKFKEVFMLPPDEGTLVRIYHSMPEVVHPERVEPTEWDLEFAIPISLFEKHVGSLGDPAGQKWTANFYKCASDTSHPHWAAWSPVSKLNFHMPECFGSMVFDP